jgi:hypothetical protein
VNIFFERRIATALFMGIGMVAAVPARVLQQQPFPSAQPVSAPAQTTIKADRSVDEVARLTCPQGIERFLPGTYYYCVGTRDVALGKNDQARSMLEIAAGWGNKSAEFLLGVGYYKGDLQPKDRARGLAWLGLASERRDPTYLAVFNSAWKQGTPREQAEAQRLWRAMLPTYGDRRAARRAAARFRHERDALLARRQTNGQQTCVAGLTVGTIAPMAIIHEPLDQTNESACDGADMSATFVVKRLDAYANQLLDGWEGHVTVGNLEAVPAPSVAPPG